MNRTIHTQHIRYRQAREEQQRTLFPEVRLLSADEPYIPQVINAPYFFSAPRAVFRVPDGSYLAV